MPLKARVLIIVLCFFSYIPIGLAVEVDEAERKTFSDGLITLGTEASDYGGQDFMKFDRGQLKNQIKTFIPPLLRPAFTQHAFVLPPGASSIAVTQRFASINGADSIFVDGDPNTAGFKDFDIDRQLTDIDIFHGFDLNTQYLHGLTLRLNIPYLASQTNGSVHPNGQQFISLENAGSTQSLGDIGLFLKKKVFDQGNMPFGLAIAGAVFLPTGSNDDTFGSNGRISAKRPAVPNTTAAQGFDAVQQANVDNGTWGDKRCFFSNFNAANRGTCNGPNEENEGLAFSAPAATIKTFEPGGENFDKAHVGDFPFNDGVFGRFSGDGRLPSTLQPGTGSTSFMVAAFLTRQFNPGGFLGRAALHVGFNHKFISAKDDIDFGDVTTVFTSFVKPLYKDYLALDLTLVGFNEEEDSYGGKIPEPGIHTCTAEDVGVIKDCDAAGTEAFVFELHDRPPFSGGFTGYFAPSLMYSPDPQFRVTLSTLIRVIDPDLGPAPENIIRAAIDFTF